MSDLPYKVAKRSKAVIWSDADVGAALTNAQADSGEVVSERVYREWLANGGSGPSVALLHHRNQMQGRTWRAMLRRYQLRYASIIEVGPRAPRVTADEAAYALRWYLNQCEAEQERPTANGYQRWASIHGMPSRVTVQRRLGRSWNDLMSSPPPVSPEQRKTWL